MGKINLPFAPLTQELGEDQRFLIDCDDFEKLMFFLIIYTTHMTRHQAPTDPDYYRYRYRVRARRKRISNAIFTLLKRFPKLKCNDGKLSLLNSPTYKSQISIEKSRVRIEEDKEGGNEKNLSHPLQENWNEICKNLPQVRELSQQRLTKCRARLKERSLEQWREVFVMIESSDFLKGKNPRGWKADFDWIIANDNNAVKVMEGKYGERTSEDRDKRILEGLRG